MMHYEISGLLEWAFDAGRASMQAEVEDAEAPGFARAVEMLRSEEASRIDDKAECGLSPATWAKWLESEGKK